MGLMVYLASTRDAALALRAAGTCSSSGLCGHAATPSLMAYHTYDASTQEDAELAALTYAGVQAVSLTTEKHPLRLVLAADLAPTSLSAAGSDPHGLVQVSELRWVDVQAVFADEPAAATAVESARDAATGHALAKALTLSPVQALIDDHDLLWFAPEELDSLP